MNEKITRRKFFYFVDELFKSASPEYALIRAALDYMASGTVPPTPGYAVQVARLLGACNTASDVQPPTSEAAYAPTAEDITDYQFPQEFRLFSILTRLDPDTTVRMYNVTDPVQRDIIYSLFTVNDQLSASGFDKIRQNAIKNGTAVYVSGCSDARFCLDEIFPTVVKGTEDVWGVTQQVNRVGAQPALFPTGVTFSAFLPHQTSCDIDIGCGFGAAVKTALKTPDGLQSLSRHGVSESTIAEIKRMIDLGNDGNPEAWARIGARVQAEMNAYQNGTNHYVVYGVYGHADNSLIATQVIDNLGNEYPLKNPRFKLLQDFVDFNNEPHPIFENIAKGQTPKINLLSGSRRFTPQQLLGSLSQEPGTVFKSSVDLILNKPLNADEATQIVGGIDYSLLHLPQSGKVLLLTADNAGDLATLRAALYAKSGSINKLISDGWVIIEAIPDSTGRLSAGPIVIKTAPDIKKEFDLVQAMAKGQLTDEVLGIKVMAEFGDIARARKVLGILNDTQYQKLIAVWNNLKPLRSFIKLGLQVTGDVVNILWLAKFVSEDLMGENLAWSNPADRTVLINDPTVITDAQVIEQNTKLSESGIIPNNYAPDRTLAELINGTIDHIEIHQNDLVDTYTGAVGTEYKYGFGSENPASPWKDLQPGELGKVFSFKVKSTVNGIMAEFITPLIIRPGFDESGVQVFNNIPKDEAGNYLQYMRLDDEVSGLTVLGSEPMEPLVFMAERPDQPELTYLFQVIAKPEERKFEIRFVNIMRKNTNLN